MAPMKNPSSDNSWQLYRRLLRYVKPYLGAFLLGLLASGIYSGIDAYFTRLMKPIIDHGFIDKKTTFIEMLPILIIGLFLLRGVASFVSSYFMSRVGRDVVMTLRNKMFQQLTTIPAQFYDNATSGQLLAKIIYNVDQIADATTNAITNFVQSLVLIIGLIVVMLVTNWHLTFIFIVVLPCIATIVRKASKRMRKVSSHVQDALGSVTHVAEEQIEGYREVRTYGGQIYELEKFKKVNSENRFQALKVVITQSTSTASVQLVGAAVLAFTIFYVTHFNSASFTAGSFVSIMFALVMLLKPLKDLTSVNNIIQQGLAGAKSVFELLDQPPEQDHGTLVVERVKGKIEYRHIHFSYQTSRGNVLRHVNFIAEPGKTIAIVGRSGSGKSTLASLLPRFYEVNEGQILIDDIDIKQFKLTSLRDQIALVSQHVTLFNDTIGHNIAYGRLSTSSPEKIYQAAKAAHALSFIEELPDGFDTLVGENGVLLSGGQRQRLAIARAILKDAPILILDEATSALDTQSERHIQAALENLMKNRTTLVIAHRLSTIEKADEIIVMENGEILETGNHQTLLAKNGRYAELYRMQFQDAA